VNSAATDIASLNEAIQRATYSGQPVNELADKRDVLVLKLADQVGATVRSGDGGVLNVIAGNVVLVSGTTSAVLSVTGPTSLDSVTATDRPKVVVTPGGTTLSLGGTAEGQLNALTKIIPDHRDVLDDVAATLVEQVNQVHRQGYDLAGQDNRDLLGPVSGPVTAKNIQVLITDPKQIASAQFPPDATGPSTDGAVAGQFAQLRLRANGADTVYRRAIVELGVRSAVSQRNLGIQSVVTANVDASRESVAGVNLDEEMSNMLQFQHAYSAAARMVTAIDEVLDVLINRTGIVGR
jgi:flagellar hook-associated protein 1 FlgK